MLRMAQGKDRQGLGACDRLSSAAPNDAIYRATYGIADRGRPDWSSRFLVRSPSRCAVASTTRVIRNFVASTRSGQAIAPFVRRDLATLSLAHRTSVRLVGSGRGQGVAAHNV